jgi:hypothetical protein
MTGFVICTFHFSLFLFCALCVCSVRRWRFEISGHSARMYTDQVTSYVAQWHWSVAPSGGFVLSKPEAVVMSMQEIQAMPRLPCFMTHICIETGRILVTESKLLRIKIKQLYYREPLLVTRFITLQLAQKHVPIFLLYTAIVCFTAHRLIELFTNKTKYFYSRQTLFVSLAYSTKQSSQQVKKFPAFYGARRSITIRQPLFSTAHNFVKMLRNNTKHFYSRQLSFDSRLIAL